ALGLNRVPVARILTPSELSKIVTGTCCCEPFTNASSASRAMRTSPQEVYNQSDRALSSSVLCTVSHGNPLRALSVEIRLSFRRLTPPSVATQPLPSLPDCSVLT